MNLVWQGRTNPLAWWWGFLTLVSGANIAAWFVLYREFQNSPLAGASGPADTQSMLLLCAAYVFGCALQRAIKMAARSKIPGRASAPGPPCAPAPALLRP